MSWPLATAEGAGYLSGSGTPAFDVQVWNGSTMLLDQLPILGGSVVEDETANIRRTLALAIDPLATNPLTGGTFVPVNPGDLLHPLSNNDVRVFRGFDLLSGATDLAPLGVFRLATPQIKDTGKQVTLSMVGYDWSYLIAQRRWQKPYIPVVGANVANAVMALILDRWGTTLPALKFNLAPTSVTVPFGTIFGLSIDASGSVSADSQNNNPWADAQTLAASAGMELFFDRTGTVVMRPVPQPNTQAIAVQLVEGSNCTLASVDRTLDATKVKNGITVIGTGARVNVLTADAGSTTVTETPAGIGPHGGNGSWSVPMNVTSVSVVISGSAGDGTGNGDQISATITCSPGDVFTFALNPKPAAGSGQAGTDAWLWAEGLTYMAVGGGAGSSIVPAGGTLSAGANSGDASITFTYNGYTMKSVPGPPVVATAWDTNPQSPTYYQGQFGQVPADPVVDPTIALQADALTSAQARLTLQLASADDTSGEIWPPNPTLDAGDTDQLTRSRIGLNAAYVISAISTPLDTKTRQSFTNRAASVTIL